MTSPTTARVPRAAVGLRSERGPVLLSVMLATGLVAIDATILATAVPAVVGDLGGLTQFPWLFSVYLLAQAVSVPVYGKVADLLGRKPVMLVGVALFVVGSLLCGIAWWMGALIAFRAVQGLGAGAIQPIGMTIVGDIYSVAERATVQGYIACVWAVSSLVGPTLGGVFAEALTWRWIFFVNLPLGVAAGWVLWRRFTERLRRRGRGSTTRAPCCCSSARCAARRAARRRGPVGLGVADECAPVLAGRRPARRVRGGRAAGGRAGAAAVGLRQPGGRRGNAGALVVGVHARALLVRAALRPGGARDRRGGRRVRAGRDDHRLADRGLDRGPPVPQLGFRATMLMGAAFGVAGSGMLLTVDGGSSVWLLAGACLVLGLGSGT